MKEGNPESGGSTDPLNGTGPTRNGSGNGKNPERELEIEEGSLPFSPPAVPEEKIFILPSDHYPLKKAAPIIFRALAPLCTLFFQCGRIVELRENRNKRLEIRAVTAAGFCSRVEAIGGLHKHRVIKDKPSLQPSICRKPIAEILIECLEAEEFLYSITTVVNSPIVIRGPRGTGKLLRRGYHHDLDGIVVAQGECVIDVPFEKARAELNSLLDDFLFENESDRARAIAAILTPALTFGRVLGPYYVPLFLIESDKSQAGKGYLQNLVAAIYGECPPPMSPRKGGVGSFDEDFDSALFKGQPFIFFDNLRDALESTHIESFFTARETFSTRTPHRGAVEVDPRRFIVFATSNGFKSTEDLENRSIHIRIRKRPMQYRFKSFPEGDLLAHVAAHQAYFHGCVLTVVLEWLRLGGQKINEMRHNFREWAQPLDWIIRHFFKDKISGRLLDYADPTVATISVAEHFGFLKPDADSPNPE
jgi:hypothetical protein